MFCKIKVAIAPSIPSLRFLTEISAPIASAPLFAKNNPSPTPDLFPVLLKGAKISCFSSIPIPSSITSIFNLLFKTTELLISIFLFCGVNLIAFCKKFWIICFKSVFWITAINWVGERFMMRFLFWERAKIWNSSANSFNILI